MAEKPKETATIKESLETFNQTFVGLTDLSLLLQPLEERGVISLKQKTKLEKLKKRPTDAKWTLYKYLLKKDEESLQNLLVILNETSEKESGHRKLLTAIERNIGSTQIGKYLFIIVSLWHWCL